MNRKQFVIVIVLTIAATFATSNSSSLSSLPPLIPREVLFGSPERIEPQLSPDGKSLSYLAPDRNGVMQIWLQTLGRQDARQLTSEKKRGIQTYFWTYDGKQLVFQQDTDGDENWHLYAIDIETKKARDLTPYKGIQAKLVALEPNFPNEMLVAMNLKDPRKHDTYRINLKTGKAKLSSENPSNATEVIADRQFQVRAAKVIASDGGSELLVKAGSDKPWKTIRKLAPDEESEVVSFSHDGKALYVSDNHSANASRLNSIDLTTGKVTVVAQDPQYDVGRISIHPVERKVEAVGFYKDKLEWQVVDKNAAVDFETLARLREGRFFIPSRDLANKTWLIAYVTDNGPVYYYTYNRDSKKSNLLFSNQSKLEGLQLASIRPISYKSRDGLTIHGYITTPVGVPAKNLPTVLLVHGGPWERDKWGYNPMVQWLANRGYAVLQVNFRGSTGYGKKFLNAGNREWGGKMQDDLVDGVNWLVNQGIADPKKVAIMGGSYGGYATLAGLTFAPNLFAAGVDIVGPSNLLTLLQSIPPYWSPIKAMFYHRIGHPEKDADLLRSRSPLFFADRIKVPLLIGQGANDPRVKQAESEQIVAAMRKAKKPVEYILYTDEGHGFARPENNLHFSAKAEEFLGKHLGGRVEPMENILGHSGIVK